MLSFIGCRDIDYLHSQLGAKAPAEGLLYESVASIHMLSDRVDISHARRNDGTDLHWEESVA